MTDQRIADSLLAALVLALCLAVCVMAPAAYGTVP